MKVLVTGATGFLGQRLCSVLRERGHQICVLSRDPSAARQLLGDLAGAHPWMPQAPPPKQALTSVDAVIHLAGETVNGRWTADKKRAIRDSRVHGTRHLVRGLEISGAHPKVLVSASAIGYYGDRQDEKLDEDSSPGNDFLAQVCIEWEREAAAARRLGLRVVPVRLGVVLGRGGGALQEMLTPFRLGLGGPLGSGQQWWSWVHIDDAVGILLHALGVEANGALNATAPTAERQRDFAKTLGRVLGRPTVIPTPGFALRLALGGFAAELLSSKRVLPRRTERLGYEFRYPQLEPALRGLLG
ncbi:MAG: TIGR01777 family oxidoreductase [Acidobacteriota bacterium]|nr:MAG: TIGR01777 family oxidoreductase [Acidobacteriota bacterium]